MKNAGLSIHCHHDCLIEFCWSYKERFDEIKLNKPAAEQPIRLLVFDILPDESIEDLPEDLQKAYSDLKKAEIDWRNACRVWPNAERAWRKACRAWRKAYRSWTKESRSAFHKKWCGCKYYDVQKDELQKLCEKAVHSGSQKDLGTYLKARRERL